MPATTDGRQLTFALDAEAPAPVTLRDGERVLYEGPATNPRLSVQAADFGVAEPLLDLMQLGFPSVEEYSSEKFVPLDTPYFGLATLRVDGGVGRWVGPAVVPTQALPLSVMAGVLHYAQAVFEGSKVYFVKTEEGVRARMYRPDRNAARMWRSALHMGVPMERTELDGQPVDEAAFEAMYRRIVRDVVRRNVQAGLLDGAFAPLDTDSPEFNWKAAPPALYVRPILFASGPVLGVKPSAHYTLAFYVTPVGKYRADLVLRVMRDQPRAWKGGTGAAKASCNYAPTLRLMSELMANKADPGADASWTDIYDDLLFLGPDGEVEEMGGANFFVLRDEAGTLTLRTPPALHDEPSSDTILPGVTRASVLELAGLLGYEVVVGELPLASLMDLPGDDAREAAVFTTGTAAAIAPVLAVNDGGRVQRFAVWDTVSDPARRRDVTADEGHPGSALHAARLLRTVLFRVQLGDEAGLRTLVPDRADALIAASRRWSRTFTP